MSGDGGRGISAAQNRFSPGLVRKRFSDRERAVREFRNFEESKRTVPYDGFGRR